MDLSGRSYIGNSRGAGSGERFRAVNPATGAEMEPVFYEASDAEVSRACELANEAFAKFSRVSSIDAARHRCTMCWLVQLYQMPTLRKEVNTAVQGKSSWWTL